MHVIRPVPDTVQGPADRFTGVVWVDRIAVTEPPSRLRSNNVHFAPGARTAWHQHPYGQVLHVTEGVGRVQQRGGPVTEVRAGDTVITGAQEWHWHGAAPHNFMTHIGIQEAREDGHDAEWGKHVTDDDYGAAAEPAG